MIKETIKKFFSENPHEIENEVLGDGISCWGIRELSKGGIEYSPLGKTKNDKEISVIAGELFIFNRCNSQVPASYSSRVGGKNKGGK